MGEMDATTTEQFTEPTAAQLAQRPLPAYLRYGVLGILALTVLYGVSYNVILMVAIAKVKSLWSAMNRLVFCMAAVDTFSSFVVALLFAYRLMGIVDERLQPVCLVVASGMMFTNMANMFIIPSMAVVRLQILSERPIHLGILHVAIVVSLVLALGYSSYYGVQGGVFAALCAAPYDDVEQGRNKVFFLMALPFFSSIGICVGCYYRIHKIICRRVINPETGVRTPNLLKPLILVTLVYVVSYAPMLGLAVVRRAIGMTDMMVHLHFWMTALNCFGYAVGSTAYSLHSARLRNAIANLLYAAPIESAS